MQARGRRLDTPRCGGCVIFVSRASAETAALLIATLRPYLPVFDTPAMNYAALSCLVVSSLILTSCIIGGIRRSMLRAHKDRLRDAYENVATPSLEERVRLMQRGVS